MIRYDTHLDTFPIHPGSSFLGGKAASKWLNAKVKNKWSLDGPPCMWLHGLHKIFAHTCMVPIIYIYYNFTCIYSFSPVFLWANCLTYTYIHAYICINTRTHTYHFVGLQILSFNSRTWNLSPHNTQTKQTQYNTPNKCQYYSLQNQILW